jgi:hypothetical protein
MSDHKMYNILNTLKSLEPTPEQTVKATAERIYESVEAKGSVLEGVKSVEQTLSEKYMGFKKTVSAIKKGGSAENPEAVAASIGRKKYGKAAFQKAAAAGKKMGEGEECCCDEKGQDECPVHGHDHMHEERETLKTKHGTIYKGGTYGTHYDGDDAPKKEKHVPRKGVKGRKPKDPSDTPKFDAPKGDIFGRTTGTAPAGKPGKTVKGHGNSDKSRNAKADAEFDRDDKMNESRKTVGTMVLESVNFKKMMDECDMTMAEMLECINQDIKTYKTTGDMTDRLRDFMHLHNHAKKQMEENKPVPYEVPAVQRKAAGAAPLTPSDVQAQDAARSMHPGMTKLDTPKPAVHDELDELAKLAGITDEGNAFTGKLHDTPKGGEFELDGKKFKDTSSLDEAMCNECGMYESQCSCQEGNLFTKHLKDTPQGGEFEIDGKKYKDTSSLEEMARLAGIFQEGKDYGDTTFPEPPTYDNTPDEQIQDEDVLLRGGDGEVAGAEKKMNKNGAARFSDNPLATESKLRPAEQFNFVEEMGRKLMKEYQGIKTK